MARIRTIKPEFPQSESIGDLTRDARLLFIQLWTLVDDFGRARASSRMLASLLYPYDDDARDLIDGWLDELEEKGHIRRYEVEGTLYLDIPNWLKHQKIDHPAKHGLPEFREGLARTRESLAPDLGPVPRTSTSTEDHSRSVASATRPRVKIERWEDFKRAYPKRKGSNPWKPAYESYERHVRNGTAEQTLIDGARQLEAQCRADGQLGTQFVPQAQTWLRQQRWGDTAPEETPSAPLQGYYAKFGSEQLDAWDAYRKRRDGKIWPRDRDGGWRVPSEWPPDYVPRETSLDAPAIRMQSMMS